MSIDLEARLRDAVAHFWKTRDSQSARQNATATRDHGARSAVTGGKQMDGFVRLVCDLVIEAGIPKPAVYCEKCMELPGYYRPEKKWDVLVVADGMLLASMEFKSQVGPSFGNNYNNRSEEAVGNAADLWAAYREGAFKGEARPWLGYMMLLEEAPGSTRPVGVSEPHFPVFPEFQNASYAKRYEVTLTRLVRDRLYDATCLLLSPLDGGKRGEYSEPSAELGFKNFAASLVGRAVAHKRLTE